ncbi:MAG: LysR family transcriptional regulator [Rhodobacterales bacterium 32-67-9]|nr:MAG: LysR family transcriptional regulator [Rhodobacterales bacterium 32-67-9]
MNFKQLEAFYWLSQFQNYRQTAEFLGLTQPAVSARVQSLEKDLGKTLIDRDAPVFRLTDQGMEIAEFALQFLNLREAMNARLLDKQKQRLSVGLASMLSFTWGPVMLAKMRERHPELVVDVYSGSDIQLRRFVSAGTLDVTFTASGERVSEADFATLFEVGWVARPDIIAGCEMPMSPETLRELPLVLYPKTSPLFNPVAEYIDELHAPMAPRHYGNSLATMCELLREGYGASALALTVLERDIASGRLVRIPVTEGIAPLRVACTHANRARRRQVGDLLAVAREAAQAWCAEHPTFTSFSESP